MGDYGALRLSRSLHTNKINAIAMLNVDDPLGESYPFASARKTRANAGSDKNITIAILIVVCVLGYSIKMGDPN